MSRLGRVRPSAGRDVIDRKACFLSLLAQAAVWLLELRVSQHFSTFYGPSVQSMDTQVTRQRSGTGRPSVEGDGPVRRPCLNHCNKSDRKENSRQAQLYSMPGEVAPGEMAADALVDIAELVGTLQGQGPPPGGFR